MTTAENDFECWQQPALLKQQSTEADVMCLLWSWRIHLSSMWHLLFSQQHIHRSTQHCIQCRIDICIVLHHLHPLLACPGHETQTSCKTWDAQKSALTTIITSEKNKYFCNFILMPQQLLCQPGRRVRKRRGWENNRPLSDAARQTGAMPPFVSSAGMWGGVYGCDKEHRCSQRILLSAWFEQMTAVTRRKGNIEQSNSILHLPLTAIPLVACQ